MTPSLALQTNDLFFARLQMGTSLAFHIIFASIGIAMPLLMVLAEWRYHKTGAKEFLQVAKLWAKGTAVFFAVGAVSGTVLSFELGLLWPKFMEHAGPLVGVPFSLEGAAFFTEAIFLGIYLYGWDKLKPKLHLLAGALVALSGLASAAFVIMVNAWMNAPRGFEFDVTTRVFTHIDPIKAMFSPAWPAQATHMIVAAYASVGAGVAGIHAWQLLRYPQSVFHKTALRIAMGVVCVSAFVQPLVGHWAAQAVAVNQPAKLAAMEGHFKTGTYAPLLIGGWPNEHTQETPFAIELPGLLSFLAFNSLSAEVKGLDAFPKDQWPPVAPVHVSFQLMVACGMALAGVGAWYLWERWRKPALNLSSWLLKSIVLCAPLGFLAIEFGWIVTEVGRQPWVIYGVMRTAEALTPMPGLWVPFVTFSVVYAALGAVVLVILLRYIKLSSKLGTQEAEVAEKEIEHV